MGFPALHNLSGWPYVFWLSGKMEIPKGKYYVYTLARSNGRVFYVGKGTGKRSHMHLYEAQSRCGCDKCAVIREIWLAGEEVKISIVFETDRNDRALAYERKLIYRLSKSGALTNVTHNTASSQARRKRKMRLAAPWGRPVIPSKHPDDMTPDEYKSYVSTLSISDEDKTKQLREWGYRRVHELKQDWRTARRQQQIEEAEAISLQIEQTRTTLGLRIPGLLQAVTVATSVPHPLRQGAE